MPKFLLIILTFFIHIQFASAQTASHRLTVADSLFKSKRYTQSFEQYQAILNQHQYSPAMLLHMAYIQEGLGHTGQAMYYLNLYFNITNDKSVLTKMEQMADKFHLDGYETSDSTWILSFYHDYYNQITIFLITLAVFLLSLTFYTKLKLHRRPVVTPIILAMILIAVGIHINFGVRNALAIIAQKNTYIMSGPSAGATVKAVVSEGHRVEIKGHNDVWIKIDWNGEDAFVKDNTLLEVAI
ncbi:MAG TPA: SH3 domain-containing protein [Cyclobacteriaceae bacterium]